MKILKILSFMLLSFLTANAFISCGRKTLENEGSQNEAVKEIVSEIEAQKTDVSGMDFEFTNRDNNDSYNVDGAVRVELGEKTGDVTLNENATYILSGKLSDGTVIVECGDDDKIQIVFDGVDISNSNGPAFYIKNADKVVITLAEGSENSLSDGDAYEYNDGDTNVDAALFSRADVTFNGNGYLKINGNAKHGICSKDDLVFTGGAYEIKSSNVALNGKDCVKISSGSYVLDAGSDGIRSDNEEDTDRGYIYISGGDFKITADNDGLQAQTVLKIDGGEFDIVCGGGSANASTNVGGDRNDNWGFGGNDFGGRPGQMRPGFRNASYTQTSYGYSEASASAESAKGIKAGNDIIICGGSFKIDSADDAVHSNGTVEIENGSFDISSGDDGIHGDTALSVSGGKIVITKSYEGLESTDLVISGGDISLVASDDGLNAAGGNDQSSMGGRPGMNGFSGSTGRIAIAGGKLVIDASGDGVDANGSINVSGGVTIVYGPTNSGNGSLDYDSSATVTGGTFIALGSAGMAQGFTNAENQGAIATNINGVSAGQTVALCDSNGKVVISVMAKKNASHLVVSCIGLQSVNKYTLVSGAEISGADENGYAENTEKIGGTEIANINLSSNIYGMSGMGGGKMPGGRGF